MYLKKIISCVAVLCMTVGAVSVNVHAAETEPSVSAASAVLYCADSGEVLYQKDMHTQRPIASITKIMTAILGLEYARGNDCAVTVTRDMYAEGSSMYLKEGEVITITELVKGMMMVSGNDAANAIALTVGGSMEGFADLMNEKAAALGMKDTHFVTPSGLDDEEHYSSAYDMALLCAYAMDNEDFAAIVSQKSINVSFIEPEGKTTVCNNHNRLLSLYEDCIGIKTGFTKTAGRTLTSCAERDGVRLIAVTLNDGNDWEDHCNLFDYGFSAVEKRQLITTDYSFEIPLVGGERDTVTVSPNCDLTAVLSENQSVQRKVYLPYFVYAPVRKGQKIGSVVFESEGKIIAQCNLIADSV
ncbi:MAG: D-alanyl-D-alanine carboxypeptidase family protein [Acutalibacteraceae bacterium]